MSQPLPVDGFEYMKDTSERDKLPEGKGCIMEVDLEYPQELHDLHNDYPLAPECLTINKVKKLVPNLHNKTRYVVHYRMLKLLVRLGLKITKIHKGIIFNERAWMKD